MKPVHFGGRELVVSSLSANDLVVDAIIEHDTFVSSANTLLTELG